MRQERDMSSLVGHGGWVEGDPAEADNRLSVDDNVASPVLSPGFVTNAYEGPCNMRMELRIKKKPELWSMTGPHLNSALVPANLGQVSGHLSACFFTSKLGMITPTLQDRRRHMKCDWQRGWNTASALSTKSNFYDCTVNSCSFFRPVSPTRAGTMCTSCALQVLKKPSTKTQETDHT